MKMLDLACFSYLASAKILKIGKYPEANGGAEITEVTESLAGDGSMVAGAVARLGLKTGLISNDIGKDFDGETIIKYLRRNQITYTSKRNSSSKTPFINVLSDDDGNREWFSYISQSHAGLENVDLGMVNRSKLIYIDCYSVIRRAALRVVDFAHQSQTSVFLNLGGDDLTPEVGAWLRDRNICIVQTNLSEEQAINAEAFSQEIFDLIKPEMVIVTLGSRGAIARTSASYDRAFAYTVDVKHVHGAGAVFSAGVAFGYLQNWAIKDTLQFGCALGSMSCTVERGFDAYSLEDVQLFMFDNKNLLSM